jgi:hypothetical protein
MKVWILFLFASFFIGVGFRHRSGAARKAALAMLCVAVTVALYSQRWT